MNLKDKRRNYTQAELAEDFVPTSPFALFEQWYHDASHAGVIEPNAMTIATATTDGKPSARVVLLKETTDKGFIFFTNYESRKGLEIQVNPQAQLLFYWDGIERQIRIEGHLKKISAADSDAYFYSRPLASQYGAMVSTQSSVIPSRTFLETKLDEIIPNPPIRPKNWGGYILLPAYFEFWQGRRSRLHDRIVYERHHTTWRIHRLAP